MKILHVFLGMLSMTTWAGGQGTVDGLVATAVDTVGVDYVAARNAVTGMGTNALVDLVRIATDGSGTWQKRLVARICYERVVRGSEIAELRSHDWRTDPEYREEWVRSVTGPRSRMGPLVVLRMRERGLWGYYIELTWKQTEELSAGHPRDINVDWARWCRLALDGQPEDVFLIRSMADRIARDERLEGPEVMEIYQALLDKAVPSVVNFLIQRYDAFFERRASGGEPYPGARAEGYRRLFKPLWAAADSRHTAELAQFLASHPALSELVPKLDEVRARPAPPPIEDPPFRLGTESVRAP